jgi:hypothetical protein
MAVACGAVVGRGVAVADPPQAVSAKVTRATIPNIHRRQWVLIDEFMKFAPSVAICTNASLVGDWAPPKDLATGQFVESLEVNSHAKVVIETHYGLVCQVKRSIAHE